MSQVLLREYYELCEGGVCQDLLTEDEKRYVANGGMILSGVMQKSDTQNGNALGELDHPDDSVINLRNASHMVTDVWWNSKDVMGKVKVLDTPSGGILRSLVESGVKLGISSRGMGSVSENQGSTIVEDDFQLICFDFVSEPSTPGAFMMKEAKDLSAPNVLTRADRINRLLNEVLNNE